MFVQNNYLGDICGVELASRPAEGVGASSVTVYDLMRLLQLLEEHGKRAEWGRRSALAGGSYRVATTTSSLW
ncbi:MAG: hypothetical protein QXP98_04715 [Thermoproteus sp.]